MKFVLSSCVMSSITVSIELPVCVCMCESVCVCVRGGYIIELDTMEQLDFVQGEGHLEFYPYPRTRPICTVEV